MGAHLPVAAGFCCRHRLQRMHALRQRVRARTRSRVMRRLDNRLRTVMRRRGVSHTDLAVSTGLSYAVVLSATHAQADPPLAVGLRIARALDEPLARLFVLEPVGETR